VGEDTQEAMEEAQ
jgi:hypothetical protein